MRMSAFADKVHDQGNGKQDDEDIKDDLGDLRGTGGDATEAENGRDQRDDEDCDYNLSQNLNDLARILLDKF